eukprot:798310-Prymnesium_polylepis.1
MAARQRFASFRASGFSLCIVSQCEYNCAMMVRSTQFLERANRRKMKGGLGLRACDGLHAIHAKLPVRAPAAIERANDVPHMLGV